MVKTFLGTIKYDISNVTGSSEFAEYEHKDKRQEKLRELEKRQTVKVGSHGLPTMGVLPDTEATNVQLHSKSKFDKLFDMSDTIVGKKLGDISNKLRESENPVLKFWRTFREKTRGSESETVKAINMVRTIDPLFKLNEFNDQLIHFIIPDLLEAHLGRDLKYLQKWFSEAVTIINSNWPKPQQNTKKP